MAHLSEIHKLVPSVCYVCGEPATCFINVGDGIMGSSTMVMRPACKDHSIGFDEPVQCAGCAAKDEEITKLKEQHQQAIDILIARANRIDERLAKFLDNANATMAQCKAEIKELRCRIIAALELLANFRPTSDVVDVLTKGTVKS
jgi:hypothetical protein